MGQIPSYPAKTAPSDSDELIIQDVAGAATKKITRGNLLAGAALPNNTVTTAAITNSNVTTAKIADSNVTTAKINNAAVTPDKLATGAATATVATQESTSSGSFVDLTTPGPAVTVTIGANGLALVTVYGKLSSATVGNTPAMSFAVSGATTQAAAANLSISHAAASGAAEARVSGTYLVTGLTAGSNTFTAKYQVQNGTGSSVFVDRRITVVPL